MGIVLFSHTKKQKAQSIFVSLLPSPKKSSLFCTLLYRCVAAEAVRAKQNRAPSSLNRLQQCSLPDSVRLCRQWPVEAASDRRGSRSLTSATLANGCARDRLSAKTSSQQHWLNYASMLRTCLMPERKLRRHRHRSLCRTCDPQNEALRALRSISISS